MAEAAPATVTATTAEILGANPARELLQDIFPDLHPALTDDNRDIGSIFTPQAASEFLRQLLDVENLFSVEDVYDNTLQKIQNQIDSAEKMRDELLEQVFRHV